MKNLHVISDEIEKALKEKPPTECQSFECHNLKQYYVKIRFGTGEKNYDELELCYDCMKAQEKIAKRFGYIFTPKLLEGQEAPIIAKKRGRPKNLS